MKDKPKRNTKKELMLVVGYGVQSMSILLGAFFLGFFLDNQWNTFPVLSIVFSIIAILGMGYYVVKRYS